MAHKVNAPLYRQTLRASLACYSYIATVIQLLPLSDSMAHEGALFSQALLHVANGIFRDLGRLLASWMSTPNTIGRTYCAGFSDK